MSVTVQELQRLRDSLQRAQQARAAAEGGLSQLMSDLKSEYGCSSVAEASVKLARLKKERERIDAEVEKGLKELLEQFPELQL